MKFEPSSNRDQGTIDRSLIERIVREVLEELQSGERAGRNGRKDERTGDGECGKGSPGGETPGPLRLSEAVITGDLLDSRLNGRSGGSILVGPRAIVTPSARDVLRRRNLQMLRETRAKRPAEPHAPGHEPGIVTWKAVMLQSLPAVNDVFDDLARSLGTAVRQELVGSASEAVAAATGSLCRGEAAGVIVTAAQPELIACQANRNDRIRAAVVSDPASVQRVRRSLKANLYCVSMAERSYFDLRNLLRSILCDRE